MDRLHAAIASRHLVRFAYTREDGAPSERTIEPICLAFWGHAWTLGAYCRLRQGFRNFRLDRISELEITDEVFADDESRGLDRYLESLGAGPRADP